MSSSQPSTNKPFLAFASIILVLTAALAASAWPAVLRYRVQQATELSRGGERATGTEAELDFHLAYWLDASNETAAVHFADAEARSGNSRSALHIMSELGKGRAATVVRLKAHLELSDKTAYLADADHLSTTSTQDQDLALAALAYGVGGQLEKISALEARVSSPEVLQRVRAARVGDLPLARELYAAGLLKSTSVFTMKLPSTPFREIILGDVSHKWHTEQSLKESETHYQAAIKLNPGLDIPYQRLITLYKDTGNTDQVEAYRLKLDRLQHGIF